MPSPTASFILRTASLVDYTPVFSGPSSDSVSFTVMAPSFIVDKTPCNLSEAAFLPFNPGIALAMSTGLFAPTSETTLTSTPGLVSFTVVV